MDGLFLVDKPAGPTSHDVVARLRKALSLAKAGHFGTLDPLATGLLLVATGQATRLQAFYVGLDKRYEGRIRLGLATDTYDAEGSPASPEVEPHLDRADLDPAVRSLTGSLEQLPPPFSAKKIKGRPLYQYARRGDPVVARASKIQVYEFRIVNYASPFLDFAVHCSSGTYIRSLAHDLGRILACGAHLASLRRTRVGLFAIEDAVPLVDLEERSRAGNAPPSMIPFDELVPGIPRAVLGEDAARRILHGGTIERAACAAAGGGDDAASAPSGSIYRMTDANGRFLALARRDAGSGTFAPFLVFGPRG